VVTGAAHVLLVDDHALLRDMLQARLRAEGFEVLATGDTTEAIELALDVRPDVAVLDIDMPGRSTFEVARVLHAESPDTRVVFLSAYVRDAYIEQALAVRASGYLCKCEPLEEILAAISRATRGATCYSPEVLQRIVIDGSEARLAERPATRWSLLTDRERDVLHHVARGLSQRQVAHVLGISVKTVQHHLTSVMDKLEIHDRVALARYAIREGSVEP
jgi:DNA-binding NarL/FixJ family response regulator